MKILDFSNLKGDLFGGITAGIVALPLALAFGVQSGMGAIYGIYGAFALGIAAALFGGTPSQVSGPTGPMTVITASVIAAAAAQYGSVEAGLGFIVASFVFCGVFQIVLGVAGVGKAIRFIPYPVLSGFMSGIGVIICLFQLMPALGLESPSGTLAVLQQLPSAISEADPSAVLLTLLTIALVYGVPRVTKAIPSALVALIVVTVFANSVGMEVAKIGDVPEGLPSVLLGKLAAIGLGDIAMAAQFGLMLAALGAIDSLLTSVVADNITKTRHDSRKELIGQGIGNILAGAIGGIPGAGATMRTVINVESGGRTKLSGIVHGVFLLIVLLGAGPLASTIPLSVLAGILITVGIGIIDYKGFRQLLHIPRTDAAILLVVLLITVFGNLLYAVAIGTILASVFFMVASARIIESNTRIVRLANQTGEEGLWSDERDIVSRFGDEVYFKHLYGPLFFGFAYSFKTLVASMPKVRWVVIRMEEVPYLDQSGAYAFEEALVELRDKGIQIAVCGLNSHCQKQLRSLQIIPQLLEKERLFDDIASCSRAVIDDLLSQPGEPVGRAELPRVAHASV